MRIITFNANEVRLAIIHAKAAPEHRAPYGVGEPKGPRLWLVGDQGVYLMSNGTGLSANSPIAYANEVHPEKMEFDDWWDAKRAIFGGDDFIEEMPLEWVEQRIADGARKIGIKITKTTLAWFLPSK